VLLTGSSRQLPAGEGKTRRASFHVGRIVPPPSPGTVVVYPYVPIGATSAVAETVVLAHRSVLNLTE
jgi:hypothetical protein